MQHRVRTGERRGAGRPLLASAAFLALCVPAAAAEATCPAANPSEGRAWVDMTPGPNDNPTLHVTFMVDAPHAGDQYTLEFSAVEEKLPPNYVYDLVRTATGSATVIMPTRVAFAAPKVADAEIGAVKINCGGKLFYEISPVDMVH